MKAGGMKGGRGGKRKGPARIGEIRVWGDGEKMRKGAGGKWEKVKEGAKKQVSNAAKLQRITEGRRLKGKEDAQSRWSAKKARIELADAKTIKVGQIRKKGEQPKVNEAQKKPPLDAKGQPPSARNVAANRKAARDAAPPAPPKKALDKERQLQSKLYDAGKKVEGSKGAAAKAARAEEKAIQQELAQHRKESGIDKWRKASAPFVGDASQRTARQREQTKSRTSKK